MARNLRILLLAGSTEARGIAAGLLAQGHEVEVLMSEPPRGAPAFPAPFDIPGEDLEPRVMRAAARADLVVDASHGFDARLTGAAWAAAQAQGRPAVTVTRPPWDVAEDPLWRQVPRVHDAMPLIPKGAVVFAATGWGSLPEMADFKGQSIILRQTARHDRKPPLTFIDLAFGSPPFSTKAEVALFATRGVTLVLCRNLGGGSSRPKLEAAKRMRLPVILIERPAKPEKFPAVATVSEALAWVSAQ